MPAGPDSWFAQAREEIASARALRAIGQARQAYHHAGQAVEFAMKAIYMKRRRFAQLPAECRGSKWHSLPHIATAAGLEMDILTLRSQHRGRYESWLTVRHWDSDGRFPGNTPSNQELNDLFLAVCHERDGIMPWLESIFQSA